MSTIRLEGREYEVENRLEAPSEGATYYALVATGFAAGFPYVVAKAYAGEQSPVIFARFSQGYECERFWAVIEKEAIERAKDEPMIAPAWKARVDRLEEAQIVMQRQATAARNEHVAFEREARNGIGGLTRQLVDLRDQVMRLDNALAYAKRGTPEGAKWLAWLVEEKTRCGDQWGLWKMEHPHDLWFVRVNMGRFMYFETEQAARKAYRECAL